MIFDYTSDCCTAGLGGVAGFADGRFLASGVGNDDSFLHAYDFARPASAPAVLTGFNGSVAATPAGDALLFAGDGVRRLKGGRVPDPAFGSNGVGAAVDGDAAPRAGGGYLGLRLAFAREPATSDKEPLVVRVTRFTADGAPDDGFGANGAADIRPAGLFAAPFDAPAGLLELPDGSVIVRGEARTPRNERRAHLLRLLPDGTLDARFGHGGVARWAIVPGARGAILDVAAQPGRGILTAESVGGDIVVRRLGLDAKPDRHFGVNGAARISFAQSADAAKMLVDPDGSTLLAGLTQTGQGLSRVTAGGRIDLRFGAAGRRCQALTVKLDTDASYYGPIGLWRITGGRIGLVHAARELEEDDWVVGARYDPPFARSLQCVALSQDDAGLATVGLVVDRASRITMTVDKAAFLDGGKARFRRAGTVSFGRRGRGAMRIVWSGRIGDRPLAPGTYRLRVQQRDLRGRVLARSHSLYASF